MTKPFDTKLEFPAGRIMSTEMELSAATEVPASVEIAADFTDAENVSADLPVSEAAAGTYDIGGYPFLFLHDVLYNTKRGYLQLDEIEENHPARIGIPIISGYVPTTVTVGTAENCKRRNLKIALTNADGDMLEGTKSQTTYARTCVYSPEPSSLNDSEQYYIDIMSTVNAPQDCCITSISVTYSPY